MSTIIVIESRPLIRRGIVQLISETIPGCHVDAASLWDTQAGDTHAADTKETAPPRYTLMLLSLVMLEASTRQTIGIVQQNYHPKSILLLADGLAPWPQALPANVIGCVPLHAHPDILQASIRLALADDMPAVVAPITRDSMPVPTSTTAMAFEKTGDAHLTNDIPAPISLLACSSSGADESRALGLTSRQYEVLVLLARGYTLKAIAQHLNIAAATAKVHAETVYQRLHVHNRTEAIYAAISRGATLGWPSVPREMAVKAEAGTS